MRRLVILGLAALLIFAFSAVPTAAYHNDRHDRQPTLLFFYNATKGGHYIQNNYNWDDMAMLRVVKDLERHGYNVQLYDLGKNPAYISMARFEYGVTSTPTLVVVYKQNAENYVGFNIVGYHSYEQVTRQIERKNRDD